MGLKLYPETSIQSIASAIRTANNISAKTYTIVEMADAVRNIGNENLIPFLENTLTEYENGYISVVGEHAFRSMQGLLTVRLNGSGGTISNSAFYGCTKLSSVYLPNTGLNNSIWTLGGSGAFSLTSMTLNGTFYVPSSLVSSYQAATNWTYYSSRFSGI